MDAMYSPRIAIANNTAPNIKDTNIKIGAYPNGKEFHHTSLNNKKSSAKTKQKILVIAPKKPTNRIGTREWLTIPNTAISYKVYKLFFESPLKRLGWVKEIVLIEYPSSDISPRK